MAKKVNIKDTVISDSEISDLVRKRGVHKRKITIIINKMNELKDHNALTSSLWRTQHSVIDAESLFIKKLDNENILRSRGRMSKCLFFDYNIHNPILLSGYHVFTQLFILDCHSKMQHLGLGTTLTFIRNQGIWIPKARTLINSILKTCIICKKVNAFAFRYPKFVDMPKHHMNLIVPFRHVGVDFTGHLWVKDNDSSSKMYILIFTCLNIRAVHFELLPDMNVKNFLLAFQRFCNYYSIPHHLYSDNAKTFLKGGSILNEALKSSEFIEELEKHNIKHIKIPLYSAWVGAAWERLIRVLKNCMYKVIGRGKLSYFEMLTSLSFIKNAINSRPLTYASGTDDFQIITPNSFIKMHSNSSLILRSGNDDVWVDSSSGSDLEKTLEHQENMYEEFKRLWYESYLLSLREHSRNLYQGSWENKIKVGDVILVKQPFKSRPFWLLGRVLEIIIGYDNNIRSVKVKQSNGQTVLHSISNLYPLELSITHNDHSSKLDNRSYSEKVVDESQPQTVKVDDEMTSSRIPRQSSLKCRKLIQDKIHLL